MSDHTGTTLANYRDGFQVLCRCGWQSGWNRSQDAADAEHELHVELTHLTADDFEGEGT